MPLSSFILSAAATDWLSQSLTPNFAQMQNILSKTGPRIYFIMKKSRHRSHCLFFLSYGKPHQSGLFQDRHSSDLVLSYDTKVSYPRHQYDLVFRTTLSGTVALSQRFRHPLFRHFTNSNNFPKPATQTGSPIIKYSIVIYMIHIALFCTGIDQRCQLTVYTIYTFFILNKESKAHTWSLVFDKLPLSALPTFCTSSFFATPE